MSGRAETERGMWRVILAELGGELKTVIVMDKEGVINSGREEVKDVERNE